MCAAAVRIEHDDERDEQPAQHEREERQLEDVEADVDVELLVGDAEFACVTEQQPALPLADRRQREEHGEEHGGAVADETQTMAEHVVEPLDVRVHVRRERCGRHSVGDEQVETPR